MGRHHLVELHDLEACPEVFRWLLTETLVWLWCQFPIPSWSMSRVAANVFARYVDEHRTTRILDLCSGSGGPMPVIAALLGARGVVIHLSDLYPQVPLWTKLADKNPFLRYIARSVDAAKVPREVAPPGTVRTFMGSFHHMDVAVAKSIIQDTVDSQNGIIVCEGTERSLLAVTLLGLGCLVLPVVFVLWVGLSWQRLLFTFLVPILPLLLCFDGVVSCIRTYSSKELMDVVHACSGSERYSWRYEEHRMFPLLPFPKVIVFTGAPKA